MGQLIDGRWQDQWYDTSKDGRFQRENAQRRNWVTADGQPGPTGEGGFRAEAGRYHLYVSLACPWAHRTLIYRQLKGLESLIDVSVVSWLMLENGWTFDKALGSTGDKLEASTSSINAIPGTTRTTPAVSPYQCSGTSMSSASSATNRRRSSACSTPLSTASPATNWTSARSRCARRSMS